MKALDLITITVPPGLPMALAIGVVYAQRRLIHKRIFSISPKRINLAGGINLALFDKTGTLTSDGLVFGGVVENGDNFDSSDIHNNTQVKDNIMECAMAVCHTLTMVDGEIIGDPLEVEIFKATGWNLVVTTHDSSDETGYTSGTTFVESFQFNRMHQIKTFPFTSETARQSVIASNGDKNYIFSKGAPEIMKTQCLSETIPSQFNQTLEELANRGLRVIAIAAKETDEPIDNLMNEDRIILEANLSFLGFIVLQNHLKPETAGILKELHIANIKTLMITGDNLLTAVAIAKECALFAPSTKVLVPVTNDKKLQWQYLNTMQIVDVIDTTQVEDFTIAMTGDQFDWIVKNRSDILNYILIRSHVFARFSPNQKADVVEYYETMNYICSFCGDGANDVCALKRASVGISLSNLEASIAAPFTSNVPNISCVTTLIKEGRAALVTTIGMFKYVALYSFIQLITVCICYWRISNLSDVEYLFIDLVLLEVLTVTMSFTAAHDKISIIAPQNRLITARTFISIFMQIGIAAAFQVIVYELTISQPWFCSITG